MLVDIVIVNNSGASHSQLIRKEDEVILDLAFRTKCAAGSFALPYRQCQDF